MRYEQRRTSGSENFKVRRKLYSQNFLRNPELITKLIRNSSIGKKDTVVDIGAGRGIITSELIKRSGNVIAVEKDYILYQYLKEKFKDNDNLNLVYGDILKIKMPVATYKVFANIPFVITADVVRKLTNDPNFQEGYLIVQKEFAQKIIGKPYDKKNQMLSVLLKPRFEISVFWEFSRNDFRPRPNVDVLMIRIISTREPLISNNLYDLYRNFIIYTYNRKKVTRYDFKKILGMFYAFAYAVSDRQKSKVKNEAKKILNYQNNIKKIHRTRTDGSWRKYKT